MQTMSTEELAERIAFRKDVAGFLEEITEDVTAAQLSGAVAACRAFIARHSSAEEDQCQADDAWARSFEQRTISFGLHAGKSFADIPISYLTWLADSSKDLRRYLASRVGQARIEDND